MTPGRLGSVSLLGALALSVSVVQAPARACVPCGGGDIALPTPQGTALSRNARAERPLLVGFDARHRTDAVGEPSVDRVTLSEQRVDLFAGWRFGSQFSARLNLPLLYRDVGFVNGGRQRVIGLGDIGARFRLDLSPLISLSGLIDLPTASIARDFKGEPLPLEVQPGAGALTTGLMLQLAPRIDDLTVRLQLSATRSQMTSGRLSALFEWAASGNLMLAAAADLRVDGRLTDASGVLPHTGGAILFAGADLGWEVSEQLFTRVGLRLPVWNGLFGHHVEGAILSLHLSATL